jgi:hypothetical protein
VGLEDAIRSFGESPHLLSLTLVTFHDAVTLLKVWWGARSANFGQESVRPRPAAIQGRCRCQGVRYMFEYVVEWDAQTLARIR